MFVDKWKEFFLSDQGVRKNTNWEKALEDTCKNENVSDNGASLDVKQWELEEWIHISKLLGSTSKTDYMRK